jgi:hypothetical protein
MRTLYTLFALISLVLVALVAATAQSKPTLIVFCAAGIGTYCNEPEYQAANLDPSTAYVIEGTNSDTGEMVAYPPIAPSFTPSPDGTFDSGPTGGFIDLGTWTFELHAIGKSGNPKHHPNATYGVMF